MANAAISKHNFYTNYLWNKVDFLNLQTWLQDTIKGVAEGAFDTAVLDGLLPDASNSNLTINIGSGIGVNENGQLLVLASGVLKTVVSPVGNPCRTLIVLRPVDTNQDYITNPENPTGPTVPLTTLLGCSVVVLDGTPNASPVYPSTTAGDIILCGLRITAGATTISNTDIDFFQRDVPKGKIRKVNNFITSNYTVLPADEIMEFDSTAGVITASLPQAKLYPGKEFIFVKVDSSINGVAITGSQTISGQTTVTIDDQWGFVKVYSNGTAWRMI